MNHEGQSGRNVRNVGDGMTARRQRRWAGFTFFEVMVTMAILAGGLVLVYRAMLTTLDHQDYLIARLYAGQLLDDRIAVIEREYDDTAERPVLIGPEVYRAVLNNQPFTFIMTAEYATVADLEDVSELRVVLSWNERGRPFQMTRAVYVSALSSWASL